MHRTPVVSENLASVRYEDNRGILEIEFRNGCVYQYFGVPGRVFLELMRAPSKGAYFTDHIKGTYRYRRTL
jgi:hypothetical protein